MVPDSSSLISYLMMIMLASYAVLLDLTPLAVGKCMKTVFNVGIVRLSCIVFYCDLVQSTQKIKRSASNMQRRA